MDKVVASRFPEELLKKMDKTVGRGTFRNRSEALRAIAEEHLREHPSLFLGDGVQYLIADALPSPTTSLRHSETRSSVSRASPN
jgi:metal-responsive CopG/Arc/MetJ family transcriptional regulator